MRVYAKNRHPFLFKIVFPATGKVETRKAWAKVRHARWPVDIVLQSAHVKKSMRLKGVGNSSTCSMAICTTQHAGSFPHPVEGHVDWNYARAFVVSKLDRMGLPSECYGYDHNHPEIAQLNDSRNGQRRLLRRLRREGSITVRLLPIRKRSTRGRSGHGRPTTGRRRHHQLRGAKLRYAVYQLGALPA